MAPPFPPELLQVASGKARLTLTRNGRGRTPSVVFLHTGISDHRSWHDVMDRLGPEMDVAAYDRRGFGTTAYRPESHDQVVDLCRVLDALGLERAVLVGNSSGGEVALNAALTHPDRVSALVLVAPAISGAPQVTEADIEPEVAAIWESLEAADTAGALDALNLGEIRLWLDGPTAPEGRVGGVRRELALDMNRIALHAESPGSEREPPDAWSRLSELALPTLVVAGDLDLRHLQARCRALAARIPGAELCVLVGAAHLPAFEQPEAFTGVLRSFLAARLK